MSTSRLLNRLVFTRLLLLVLPLLAWFAPPVQAAVVPLAGVSNFTTTTTWQGVSRTTLYFKPATPAAGTRAPLLVMLHYLGGNAENMSYLANVQKLVRDTGAWVMLPQAVAGAWHDDPADGTSTTDDVGFISALIDKSIASYPLNAQRVYLSGFSDGSMMSLRYICEAPARIAAAAIVSGVMLKSTLSICGASPATPVAMINGTADTIVRYNVSPYAIALSVPDSAKFWAGVNGCGSAPVVSMLPDTSNDGTTVQLSAWKGCATGDAVSLYTINNGGHTWPNSVYNLAYQGRTSYDIDGTSVVWQFVQNFSR